MCRATLLPDPDSPLRMMMRTAQSYPAAWPLQVPALVRLERASNAQRACLRGMVVVAFLLVLLDAPIELVRHEIDGRIHVLFGRHRVDGAAARVQGRFGLLA